MKYELIGMKIAVTVIKLIPTVQIKSILFLSENPSSRLKSAFDKY